MPTKKSKRDNNVMLEERLEELLSLKSRKLLKYELLEG